MIKIENLDNYLLLNGDCFKTLRKIPDHSVDMIFTDPPYNLANYSTGNMNFDWRSNINNDVAKWDEVPLNPRRLLKQFKRILKPTGNIFVFCSYNILGNWHKVFDPEFDIFQICVWHKTNPIPNIRKSSFLNSCELICCMWNKGHTWNFKRQNEMHNFFESPICMGLERLKEPKHPTQKPIKLLKHFIEIATNENDVILDCFMGVGSTGVAALELKRKFIGIEIDNLYYNASVKRIEKINETINSKEIINEELNKKESLI